MTKDELNQALQFLNNPQGELQIILYAVFKDDGEPKKIDIRGDDLPQIREIFTNGIQSYVLEKDDHVVLPLSTADERGKCFYTYDLELPEELEYLENVIGNDDIENFNFNDDQLTEIDALIVVIADNEVEISLFKKLSPVEVVGRGGYMLWKSNQRFERFEEQLLRISPRFQIIRVDGEVVIIDLNAIEKSFGFHDVITREATVSLDVIRNMEIVSDMAGLEELVSNVSFARKLTKVARSSPVIQHAIPNANIIAFSKKHPATRNMKYTEDESQFDLDTRVSKDLFIKILNDDLLTSELTKLYYDSLAKDGIEIEDDENQDNEDVNNE